MNKKIMLGMSAPLTLISFALLGIGITGCPGGHPTSPASPPTATPTCNGPCPPTSTATPTVTVTTTITPTRTVTPTCSSYTDITSSIDGADLTADDTGHTMSSILLLDKGGTTAGDVYTFTLTSSKVLNFSLCPTSDPGRDLVMYVRPSCWNTIGESFNDDTCDALPEITGLSLAAGTYYVLIAENSGSTPGSYVLRIKSGTVSTVCTVTPTSTPQAVASGTYTDCTTPFDLNGGSQVGTGDRVGTGEIDDSSNTDDYYSFTPSHSGSVTVTLDCFDNGLGTTDFDIYGFSDCPTSTSVGSSTSTTPVEKFTFTAVAHTTYYVDVNAYFGMGTYRLTVRTP